MPSKFQDLVDATLEEKAEATGRLERFKGFFRRQGPKSVPSVLPSAFEFISDEELRKVAEGQEPAENSTLR